MKSRFWHLFGEPDLYSFRHGPNQRYQHATVYILYLI
jgi:hypothetical protein